MGWVGDFPGLKIETGGTNRGYFGGGWFGGEDVASLVAADFDGFRRRELLEQREVVGGCLDGVDVGCGGAAVEFSGGEGGKHNIEGHLYGGAVFKRGQSDGVVAGAVGFDEISRADVVEAEGPALQCGCPAFASAGENVTTFGIKTRL